MKVPLLAVVAAGLLAVPNKPPKKDVKKDDATRLQGSWTAVSAESAGRSYTADRLQNLAYRVTFQGNTYALQVRGRTTIGATFKLDPAKKPRTIDLAVNEGVFKGKTIYAIYTFEGDTLKICQTRPLPEKDRPTAFATKAGVPGLLFVLKKEKR
jgi:uncharacterized protein (TIGR03067 family)